MCNSHEPLTPRYMCPAIHTDNQKLASLRPILAPPHRVTAVIHSSYKTHELASVMYQAVQGGSAEGVDRGHARAALRFRARRGGVLQLQTCVETAWLQAPETMI